jgi:hypothetical protein
MRFSSKPRRIARLFGNARLAHAARFWFSVDGAITDHGASPALFAADDTRAEPHKHRVQREAKPQK